MKLAIAIVVTMAALLTGTSAHARWQLKEPAERVESGGITFNLGREGVYAEVTQQNPTVDDGDGNINHEDADIDGDGLSHEPEAVLVEEESMTCVKPCSPWDTQSTH